MEKGRKSSAPSKYAKKAGPAKVAPASKAAAKPVPEKKQAPKAPSSQKAVVSGKQKKGKPQPPVPSSSSDEDDSDVNGGGASDQDELSGNGEMESFESDSSLMDDDFGTGAAGKKKYAAHINQNFPCHPSSVRFTPVSGFCIHI